MSIPTGVMYLPTYGYYHLEKRYTDQEKKEALWNELADLLINWLEEEVDKLKSDVKDTTDPEDREITTKELMESILSCGANGIYHEFLEGWGNEVVKRVCKKLDISIKE